MDGSQIRGIPESKSDDVRCRQEHDFNEVQKAMEHINFEAAIRDVTRLGKHHTNITTTILLKVPNPYQKRTIPLSARKRQLFGRLTLLSRQLSKKKEEEGENLAFIRGRELLPQGANPRRLRVRDGVLYGRGGKKRTPDGISGTGTT